MSMGNNRDYWTADRRARTGLKRHAEIMATLIEQGMERAEASRVAFERMTGTPAMGPNGKGGAK